MNEAPDRTIILGLQHWVTRPDLETIFETKMVSNWSRDHFETKMSHYLEWRDWFRDHIRDQNGLNSGLETSIDTKMSHSDYQETICQLDFCTVHLCPWPVDHPDYLDHKSTPTKLWPFGQIKRIIKKLNTLSALLTFFSHMNYQRREQIKTKIKWYMGIKALPLTIIAWSGMCFSILFWHPLYIR